MNQDQVLQALSTKLGLVGQEGASNALAAWLAEHWILLQVRAADLLAPPFKVSEVQALGQEVTKAVQDLKVVFVGQDRAEIADTVFEALVATALPATLRDYVLPILKATGVRALIQAAFEAVFGAPAATPIIDASSLPHSGPSGGVK